MVRIIPQPTVIQAEGTRPKRIEEFVGNVTSGTPELSIARMDASEGWVEPGQTPAFDEYTLVLSGTLRVETREGSVDVPGGQAVVAKAGEWVRYSAPLPGGAQYVAVCHPAFSPATVNRD